MKRASLVVGCVGWLLLGCVRAGASSVTDQQFDFACAINAAAEIGTSARGSEKWNAAMTLHTFYIGRLTARDEITHWVTVITGRVAEMRGRALSEELFLSCMHFFTQKIQ